MTPIYAVCPKCCERCECCGLETVSPLTSRVFHFHDGTDWPLALMDTLAQAQDYQKRLRRRHADEVRA